MEFLKPAALVTAIMCLSAATAGAVSFSFANPVGGTGPNGTPLPGDTVTLDLMVATEAHDLQAFFLQVNHPGMVATAATIVPFIFLGGIPGTSISAPVINSAQGGNATGEFSYLLSPGTAFPPGQGPAKFGSISLVWGVGYIQMAPYDAGGGVFGPGLVDLVDAGAVSFEIYPIIPEPTTALLLGIGLFGLGALVRRK